jgi:hypothetical protein
VGNYGHVEKEILQRPARASAKPLPGLLENRRKVTEAEGVVGSLHAAGL